MSLHRNNSIVDIVYHDVVGKIFQLGKTMKESFNKISQTSTAILISWIIVYGIMYAQQVCCSTTVDACIPISNRILGSYAIANSCETSPSHHCNNQLQSNFCSKNFLSDFGEGNICCETNRCNSYNQAKYFSLSSIQNLYPLQKTLSSFTVSSGAQTNFEPKSLSPSLKAVPIYILTQSIIC